MENIINVEEFKENLIKGIREIVEDSTFSEICNYIEMLPIVHSTDESLYSCGVSYINDYYKKVVKLEDLKNDKNQDDITETQYELYILYSLVNYNNIHFTFKEFIVYSKLLCFTFTDYNPNKKRLDDKKLFESGDAEIDNIVNEIVYHSNHSKKEHAFEFTTMRLQILAETLKQKQYQIMKELLNKMDVEKDLEKFNLCCSDMVQKKLVQIYKYNHI